MFHPEIATWEEASVLVTASEDAGAGWIDRWDEGSPVRFATSVPDPAAFEEEYLSVLTGDTITQVQPDPTITVTFEGKRCTIEPRRITAGPQIVAYVDKSGEPGGGGLLISLTDPMTYEGLRDFLGPDGSVLPNDTPPPKGLGLVTFLAGTLQEAQVDPSVIAGVCATEKGQGWLTPPVEAEP